MNFFRRFIALFVLGVPLSAFAFPIAAPGTEGNAVLVSGTDDIIARYEGNSAGFNNNLYLVTDDGIDDNDILIFNNHGSPVGSTLNLGSFAVGTELIFRLHVTNNDFSYYTGAASRNPDQSAHARVQANWAENTTLVSFEDLLGGPFDFNDLSFSFTNTSAGPADVPEPATILLMSFGLAGVATMRRRRK